MHIQLRTFILALGALALLAFPALAADNYVVTDRNGALLTIKSKDTGSGIEAPQTVTSDASGNPCNGTTGAAVPACGTYIIGNTGGNGTAPIFCGSSAFYDAATSGSTQVVALSSGKIIYVCGYTVFAGGTTNVDLRYGTGSNCATGATKITPAYQLTAQTGVSDGSSQYRGLATIASNELCLNSSQAIAVQAIVYFTQF